ncbi:MAG: hypothetical protein JSR46_08810 [Verrucomicrobia bacterium]|nr:hypothetical protein [Verrucomicrobiota bacterium]
MKIFHLAMLAIAPMLPCVASDEIAVQLIANGGMVGQPQMTFNNGSTFVTISNYHIKIIAEQRLSDNLVQVVAIPSQTGVQFNITGVSPGEMPPSSNMGGPAVNVQGVVSFRTGGPNMTRVPETIPVQLNSVTNFSISADTATMQGYSCLQRQM